jgi:outer membrane biosynthesis protein TonB
MRRVLIALFAVLVLTAARADAVTIRDLIELSKAGLGDDVLIALIEVDRRVFTIDTATLKQLKEGGVSEPVIVALIRSGRTPRTEPAAPAPAPEPRQPEVIVVDHHDSAPAAPAPAPVAYPVPVAVPVYVPVPTRSRGLGRHETVTTILPTDQGLVKARVPVPANCVKAEPVYWGFGGKLRPGSWEPPPTVVCR